MAENSADNGIVAELAQRFRTIAGDDGSIDRNEFRGALGLKDEYLADRLFTMVDEDSSGEIELEEFLSFVGTLMDGSEEEQLRFAFRLHDPDDSGEIDRGELQQLIQSAVSQHGLEIPKQAVIGLADALFKHADKDESGEISFDEFCGVLDDHPLLKSQLTLSAAHWLRPVPVKPPATAPAADQLRKAGRYIANNKLAVFFLIVYGLINAALFVNAVETYAASGVNIYVQIARGCGAALNFNGALILVPMLRYLLTYIRQSMFGKLVPVDESIVFHKMVGHVLMVLAVVHTIAHLLNYSTLDQSTAFSLLQTSAGLTGVLLLAVFLVMWVCALDFVRRRGHFELFYFTHFAFIIWFVLAILHGPVFWQWALLPLVGYVLERIIRFQRTHSPMPIKSMTPLASGVTRLELQLPENYSYQSGDYVFVRHPGVSHHEWHPFTVTTAPEERGILSVHVRGLGNWTRRLYAIAKEHTANPEVDAGVAYLDGPYGTPSTHIFHSKVAVLIGAGIGVTPFAAILKSIFFRRDQREGGIELEKVHFIWMNRDQFSFEWFSDMLAGLEEQDTDGVFLDIQVYLTGVKLDMTSALLDVALELHHENSGRDLFTGLKHRTRFDRPNWPAIFGSMSEEHSGKKVDIYFCGPPGLSKQLNDLAARNGFGYRKENF